jgi:hypothetical protein
MKWFTRRPKMTLEEELEVAIRICTSRGFGSLPADDQSRGYYGLAAGILAHAIRLEEAES